MLIAKIIGTGWMLAIFLLLLKHTVINVNNGLDPFSAMLALALTWLLTGLAPVAIVKFAWVFIG